MRRVVVWYKLGFTSEEISDRIGHLSLAQIHGALAYYHANRESIESDLADEEAQADRLETEFSAGPQQEPVKIEDGSLQLGRRPTSDL